MRRSALTLALVGVLALGGCGGEASPKPAPLTKTPSPTASPTRPPEAVGLGQTPAEETVKYYLAALSYASNTGDVSALRPLGSSTCASCAGVIKTTEEIYGAGGKVSGSSYTVEEFTQSTKLADGYRFSLKVRSADEQVARSASASPTRNPGAVVTAQFQLAVEDGQYVVARWGES